MISPRDAKEIVTIWVDARRDTMDNREKEAFQLVFNALEKMCQTCDTCRNYGGMACAYCRRGDMSRYEARKDNNA